MLTEGPWMRCVACGDAFKPAVGQAGTDKIVCTMADGTTDEDAQLIAAAPMMLKALKAIRAALEQNKVFPSDISFCKLTADIAIALTEGKVLE